MRHWSLKAASLLTGLIFSAAAFGQLRPDHSLLDELDRQTQALYRQVALSVVRVQLPQAPATRPAAGEPAPIAGPLVRWDAKLSPETLAKLEEAQARTPGVAYVAEILPATQPAVEARLALPVAARPTSTISPNIVGFVVDDQGHALLPAFISRQDAGDAPLAVLLADGSVAQASFVGSDERSGLTVIQVLRPGLRPLALSSRPPEGGLVMVLSLDPAATHLAVWTRWANNWGLILRSSGAVAGFSQPRRFVDAAACIPVAQDLIRFGRVQPPRLGVAYLVVGPDDPQRQLDPALGQTPAIRVFEVLAGFPAARAGVRPGDLILSLDGRSVGAITNFKQAITEQNGPVQLQILREDQLITVTVDLKQSPPN